MTTLPISYAPPIKCHRDLGPGEVKRIAVAGKIVGCYVACPACGAVAQVTEGLTEEGLVAASAVWKGLTQSFSRPTSLSSSAISCRGCARVVALRGTTVEATP